MSIDVGVRRATGHHTHNVQVTESPRPQPAALPAGLIGQPYTTVTSVRRHLGLIARPAYAVSDTRTGTVTVTVAVEPPRYRKHMHENQGQGEND